MVYSRGIFNPFRTTHAALDRKKAMSSFTRLIPPLLLIAITTLSIGGFTPVDGREAKKPKRILVVTVTKGFRHESIPVAERLIQKLADQSKAFEVDYARTDEELAQKTTQAALAGYGAIVFAHTTGDLPLADRNAFFEWVKAGHGFVGIHSATDTFHGDAQFLKLVGGEFDYHREQATVQVLVEDPKHPASKGLGKSFQTHDEIYLFKNFVRADVHMILAMDKHPNTGEAGYYPLAWSHEFGKGRAFYTALGHRDDVLDSAWYGEHLLGGITWALGG
jgi:uncharacterized protein